MSITQPDPSGSPPSVGTIISIVVVIAAATLTAGAVIFSGTTSLPSLDGGNSAPPPAAEVSITTDDDTGYLRLQSATATSYLVVTSDGALVDAADGTPAAYPDPTTQTGETIVLPLGNVTSDSLTIRARPAASTPAASPDVRDQPYQTWPIVDRVPIPS